MQGGDGGGKGLLNLIGIHPGGAVDAAATYQQQK